MSNFNSVEPISLVSLDIWVNQPILKLKLKKIICALELSIDVFLKF